jgi:uncharacterized protein
MITYIDTSTLLKLIIDEEGSDGAELIWQSADMLASVNLVLVEARAALAAAFRQSRLTSSQHRQAKATLLGLVGDLYVVAVTDELLENAADLAEEEALRGYDAVHLAGALCVGASVMTSADTELCDAALRRGLHIANPLAT